MKLLPAAMLLCPALAAAADASLQARCEEMIKGSTVLTAKQNGYTVDRSRSWRALTRMHKGSTRVLGLTHTESRMSIDMEAPILQHAASGYECVVPRLKVNLYYAPIVIYVGKEFEPGTCAYREILAHEMRHLKTYLDYLPTVESAVRTALKGRFDNQPIYAPIGQAQALLEQEIDTNWMPYIKNEMAKVEALQAAIDTPQEYARLSKICKGEVQSLIGPANRTRTQQ